MQKIILGSDPELFMKDSNNNFVSAWGMIPGDKKNPFAVEDGAVQVDGMALEFNTLPAEDEEQWVYNLSSVMSELKAMVPEFTVVAEPVAYFSEEHMKAQPKEALELGCDPDFNAWQFGNVNPKPDGSCNKRTGAGHVHVGWTKDEDINDDLHVFSCHMIVKQLDFYLGLPSLLFDDNTERRSMYGKAGCHRVKSYGVEYRVLSNAWLRSEELQRWVYKATNNALADLQNGIELANKYGNIEHIINNSDVEQAKAIIREAGLEVPNGYEVL